VKSFTPRAIVALLALLFATAAADAADAYPRRPIRLIIPYTAGGATDLLARAVATRLGEALGQQVVPDNRPGANTIIGFELQATAAPDGYTLLTGGFNGLVLNPLLYRKLPYNVERDIASVAPLGETPLIVVVHPSVPAKTLNELVAYARARPGALNFASGGTGNITHVAVEEFMAMTGIRMEHVPYKGGAAGMTDQLSGQVQLKFDTPITALPHVQAGRLRALAVTSRKRLASAPDVPTVAELGYPSYDAATWFSIMTRKGTPQTIVERLNREIQSIVTNAELRAQFASLAITLESGSPQDLDARVQADTRRYGEVIRKAHIVVEQ
jgi:tripartite-type tricarboxylate transporter receptor subunit TctC